MSGVAAVLELRGKEPEPGGLEAVMRVLEGRGPDGTSTTQVGPVLLGCARLDTLPEDGPQPVTICNVTAVADARLDNRPELGRALKLPDSVSDTELIAASVARWGVAAAERLEGDFAVLAWDGEQLIAFRDRFGVRPLFYTQSADRLILASEIHALLAHPRVRAAPNRDYFIEQLAAHVPPTRQAPYQGIRRIRPGELAAIRPGKSFTTQNYYYPPVTKYPMSLEEAAEQTRHLLDDAVRSRLRTTGPVACDVSGGMDSTSIYASCLSQGVTPRAISIVSDAWPSVDERSFSRALIGTRPWSWVFAEAHLPLANSLAVAGYFDEPMQDVAYEIRLHLNKLRPANCRTILSGHGGDGLMTGGFGALQHLIQQRQWFVAYREARLWADLRDRPLLATLRRAASAGRLPVAKLPWASQRVAQEAARIARRVSRDLFSQASGNADIVDFLRSTEAGLRQQSTSPVDMRYPFLHRPLVEHALSIPASLKASAGMGKRVLRRAMSDRLPTAILERSLKSGFATAYAHGIRENYEAVQSWLQEPVLAELNILSAAGFRTLAQAFREGRVEREMEVLYALADEAWLQARVRGVMPPDDRKLDLLAGSPPAYDGVQGNSER